MIKQFSRGFNFCSLVLDKERLMNLSLMYAATKGFNERSIVQACNDMQISSSAHTLIKPVELIHFAMKRWNMDTLDAVPKDFSEQKHQIPYINRWNEAMATGANPSNAYDTSQILWHYAEDSWYLSGDRSIDYNFYTKRLLFLYVYSTTELHMLTDKSIDFEETWIFLDRRLEDILQLGPQIDFVKNLTQTFVISGSYLTTLFKNFPNDQGPSQ